jgi:hypothetical protein
MCWQRHDQFRWSEYAERWERWSRHEADDTAAARRGALRVSDAERQTVIEELRQHTGDGRLTLDEFEDRVDEVLRARTRAELDTTTRELPSLPRSVPRRRSGFRLPVRPGVIAACLLVVLVIAWHWWVLFPIGFFIFRGFGRHTHHGPGPGIEDRDDSVAPV